MGDTSVNLNPFFITIARKIANITIITSIELELAVYNILAISKNYHLIILDSVKLHLRCQGGVFVVIFFKKFYNTFNNFIKILL